MVINLESFIIPYMGYLNVPFIYHYFNTKTPVYESWDISSGLSLLSTSAMFLINYFFGPKEPSFKNEELGLIPMGLLTLEHYA